MPSLIIWTVLVIFQVVLLTKEFGKKDLEILKYHYSYGICKGTDLIVFEKKIIRMPRNLKREF
jgi:hypothetical protein